MRFGLGRQRTALPARVREKRLRGTSTYGLDDSDSDGSSTSEQDEVIADSSSESEDSFWVPDATELQSTSKTMPTSTENAKLTEAMALIRLHVDYKDPVEEWKRNTKQEAFELAQSRLRETKSSLYALYTSAAEMLETKLENTRSAQRREVEQIIQNQRLASEKRAREQQAKWDQRNKDLWAMVDNAIAAVDQRLEAERKKQEEARLKEREEKERKIKLEQEKQAKEEAEKRRTEEEKKQKEEQEKKKKADEERQEAEAREKSQRLQQELGKVDNERKAAGITTQDEDWITALTIYNDIKHQRLKRVKDDPVLRREWARVRRLVTLRIGQITNSDDQISTMSQIIGQTMMSLGPETDLYAAALSALVKAIILQTETEVTAKIETAGPLAAVITNLFALPNFASVLSAKMIVRSGGWLVGKCVDRGSIKEQDEKTFRKLAGYRDEETNVDRNTRIGGLAVLYFAICATKPRGEMPVDFRPPKLWLFFARIMSDQRLMKQTMAPYIMHSALEVAADAGAAMFGKQWRKLLFAIGEATVTPGRLGGGDEAGKTARVRLQLKAEELLRKMGALR